MENEWSLESPVYFSDSQNVRVVRDKLCGLSNILRLNKMVFESAKKMLCDTADSKHGDLVNEFSNQVDSLILQLTFNLQRTDSIFQRLEGVSQLVSRSSSFPLRVTDLLRLRAY